ncbi:MAG: gliding motility-associated C-terminal domain-containing protein, partial [Bacteroidota bacterium]
QLTGEIPVFNSLSNLIILNCNDNELIGSIPDPCALPSLEIFNGSNNLFTGCYPDNICNLLLFNTINNSSLPWEGDHTYFCNGQTQIGGSCNDGYTYSINDIIQNDCSCEGTIICDRTSDSLALVSLYNTLGGNSWTYSSTEFNSGINPNAPIPNAGNAWDFNMPINTWHGVQLNSDGCVEVLGLNNNGLVGELPDLNLPQLKIFNCASNQQQLTGNIPNFSSLVSLEYFDCSGNELNGEIPDFNHLPNLVQLRCYLNELTGEIPNFTHLPNLEILRCQFNQLSGSIPNFTSLTSLVELNCFGNQITGTLPSFSSVPNLDNLDCSFNQITGQVPSFEHTPLLRRVRLDNNRLSGDIPDLSLNCPNLSLLYVDDNLFTFENILPSISNHQNIITQNASLMIDSLRYSPQDSIYTDTLFTMTEGDFLSIDLTIDENISTNRYFWFKDGLPYDTINGNNNLDFNNILLSDAGTYWVHVKNDSAPELTLESYPIQIMVSPAIPTNDDCIGIEDLGIPPVCNTQIIYNNINATSSNIFYPTSSNNIPSCWNNVNNDVWFEFTVPSDGSMIDFGITLTANNTNGTPIIQPQMALYIGDCLPNQLAEIACVSANTGSSSLEMLGLGLTPGITHFIRVDAAEGNGTPNWGDFTLCIDSPSCVFSCTNNLLFPATLPFITPDLITDEDLSTTCSNGNFQIEIFNNLNQSIAGPLDSIPMDCNFAGQNLTITLTETTFGFSCSNALTVTEDFAISATSTDATCANGNDGTATVSATGGTSPYNFDWGAGIDPNALSAETYTVTATDVIGCTEIATVTIEEGINIDVSITGVNNLDCANDFSGSISVNGMNGTPPYSATWSNGMSGLAISGLAAGTYTPTLSDANGCTQVGNSITISQPQPMSISETIGKTSCPEVCDGSIAIAPMGGAGGYLFDWSNGMTSDNIAGLCPGNYTLTLTDINGCTISESYEVTAEPNPIFVDLGADTTICQGTAITLTASGANCPTCTYTWSQNPTLNTAQTTITPTASTIYSVTVTDANGCSAISERLVEVLSIPSVPVVSGADEVCDGDIQTYDISNYLTGVNYSWQLPTGASILNNSGATVSIDYSNASSGDLCLMASNICDSKDTCFTVVVSSLPASPALLSGNTSVCEGETITYCIEPINNADTYTWNLPIGTVTNEQTCQTITWNLGSTANLSVAANNGCGNSPMMVIPIDIVPLPSATIISDDLIACEFESYDVAISFTGTPPFALEYSDGIQNYSLTGITDNPLFLSVATDQPLNYSLINISNDFCTGNVSGTMAVEVESFPLAVITEKICDGDFYEFGNELLTTAGFYENTFISVNGCDSVVQLELSVEFAFDIQAIDDESTYSDEVSNIILDVTENDTFPNGNWAIGLPTNATPVGNFSIVMDSLIRYELLDNSFSGQDSFEYYICQTNCPNNCDTAQVLLNFEASCLREAKANIKNGFTPNNDGINDFFHPFVEFEELGCQVDYSQVKLTIVNRWGEIVFQADPYPPIGWNGANGEG